MPSLAGVGCRETLPPKPLMPDLEAHGLFQVRRFTGGGFSVGQYPSSYRKRGNGPATVHRETYSGDIPMLGEEDCCLGNVFGRAFPP